MKLTSPQKVAIVEAIQSKKATMTELAERYGVDQSAISYHFKKITGRSY
jgi:DNA-binding transcriptional ArsR family regulator